MAEHGRERQWSSGRWKGRAFVLRNAGLLFSLSHISSSSSCLHCAASTGQPAGKHHIDYLSVAACSILRPLCVGETPPIDFNWLLCPLCPLRSCLSLPCLYVITAAQMSAELDPSVASSASMDVEGAAVTAAARPSAPHSVDLLSLLKSAQLSNGLRHGDYQRYRQYCTRRIRRLRVALHHTAGKRNPAPRPLPNVSTEPINPLFLTLTLTEAERCWAYAQQLAGERTDEAVRPRFHQLKRLRRAVQHSAALLELCAQCADQRTRVQAEAYHAELSGAEAMERHRYEHATRHFIHAQTLYRALSRAAGGGGDIAHISQERADAQNDQIRLSRYFQQHHKQAQRQQGTEPDEDDEDADDKDGPDAARQQETEELASYIATLNSEAASRAGSRVDSVTWLGEQVAVSSDRLAALLTRARLIEAEVSSSGGGDANQFASLAALYVNAGAAVKEELLEAKLEAHRANLNKLSQYCHTQSATTHSITHNSLMHSHHSRQQAASHSTVL